MKNLQSPLFLVLLYFCFSTSSNAQWKSLGSNNLANENGNIIFHIHALNEAVVWGLVFNPATFSPTQTYIKTTDFQVM